MQDNIITVRSIKMEISRLLGCGILEEIMPYVQHQKPSLWGMEQPPDFLLHNVLITMYHDMSGSGWNVLKKQCNFTRSTAGSTLSHNAQVLRPILASWARTEMPLEDMDAWNAAAHDVLRPAGFESVNMWIDSTDFAKKKRKGQSKKDSDFSYKLNKPGLRFMTLQDGRRQIRKIWGPYPPKLYDGDFLQSKKYWIKRRLLGANIIGDDHFRMGKKYFKGKNAPKFTTAIRKRADEPNQHVGRTYTALEKLTKEKQKYNEEQKALRARVESPYGWVKETFKTLHSPWLDDEEQLEHAVVFAFGCHNYKINH